MSCDCYDEGYADGRESALREAEAHQRARVETPMVVAARGTVWTRTTSRQVRDWAEAQSDDRLRWWLLGMADVMEQLEADEAKVWREARERRERLLSHVPLGEVAK